MITVVGLGFNKDSVSMRGLQKIKQADKVIFRTKKIAFVKGVEYETLDFLYEKAISFDELNKKIADELIARSEGIDLVYCVDGDGYKDSSVTELLSRTDAVVIPGPFDIMMPSSTECVYIGAYDALSKLYPDTSLPLCIYGIDDKAMAGEVKLFLMNFYGAEREVRLCSGEGCQIIKLFELDRQNKYSASTAVYIEGSDNYVFADLLRIMARLTAPDGCPWDKAQTHESIRINLLEEAYETVEAITDENIPGMIEELGDILLQVVFHCDIASRCGEFSIGDVIKGLNDKLIGRHTHIFGSDKAESADGALGVWERNKMKEKHQDTFAAAVNDVPKCFPALLRAQKVAKRVMKGGWSVSVDELKERLADSLNILIKVCDDGNESERDSALGYFLMLTAFLAQKVGGNSEQALLDKVWRVQKVYTSFENAVIRDGKNVNDLTDEERQRYFSEAYNAV